MCPKETSFIKKRKRFVVYTQKGKGKKQQKGSGFLNRKRFIKKESFLFLIKDGSLKTSTFVFYAAVCRKEKRARFGLSEGKRKTVRFVCKQQKGKRKTVLY